MYQFEHSNSLALKKHFSSFFLFLVLFKQNLNKIYVEKVLSDFTMPGPIQESKGIPAIFPKKDKKRQKNVKKAQTMAK